MKIKKYLCGGSFFLVGVQNNSLKVTIIVTKMNIVISIVDN